MNDFERLKAVVEEYRQKGGDMDKMSAFYQSLSAADKTPLGLNQWVLSDKPRMAEFNEDNRIVDERLRELDARFTPPNRQDIPLQGEFRGQVIATKNAVGDVFVYIDVVHERGLPFDIPIAVLPEAFRPTTPQIISGMVGVGNESNLQLNSGWVTVDLNGQIKMLTPHDGTVYIRLIASAHLLV